jgi:nonribosomal peptide synthetase protein VioO
VLHNGRPLSYGRLYELASEVASRLGPRPGPVGVIASHRPATIVNMLGIWLAGGVYCPVDPAFPLARREAMAQAAGWHLLVAEDGVAFDAMVPGVVSAAPVTADEPAYALFTSGSTGHPKPVITPRGAISAVVSSLRELFGITPADRVLQFASLNWDTCFEEILPTLTSGGTVVFDDDAYTGSFPRFLRMIQREQVTVLDLPTAFWHELVGHLVEDDLSLPECVRLLIIGGEGANPRRLAEWSELKTSELRLLNTYGCTETTLITHAVDLWGPAAPPDTLWHSDSVVPIGYPLPHVVERIDEVGELLIGGPALALGYGGLPDVTAERFVFLDGHQYFRTRDRVSRSDGGPLIHRGRLDHEVKVRGIRVDPGEVEARIAEHPDVAGVAVTGVSAANRTVLVAYVVARPTADGSTLAAALAADLRTRLPGHLVPSRIRVVDALAYTASGKVDRAGSHQRHAANPTRSSS